MLLYLWEGERLPFLRKLCYNKGGKNNMNTKKLSVGLLTALCSTLIALLSLFFFIPHGDLSAYADDSSSDSAEPVSVLVNGQTVSGVPSFS